MTERRHAQLTLSSIVLFGLAISSPDDLLDPELRRIEPLLDDEPLLDLIVEAMQKRWPNSATRGRRGTPAEVALRLLVLRKLRGWTFDRLEWEVTGNIAYRRFCRIDAKKVPDAKTMIRIEHVLGGEALECIFRRVTEIAVERKATTGRKMRVDTTVVEAPIHYPTDSSLCEDIVRVIRRGFERVVAAGVKLPPFNSGGSAAPSRAVRGRSARRSACAATPPGNPSRSPTAGSSGSPAVCSAKLDALSSPFAEAWRG